MPEWTTIKTGEIQGSATAAQMPSVTAVRVIFRAQQANSGNVYIGGSGVTKPDGTTDATTGFELDAGQTTEWIPVPGGNLNNFYRICDNAGDDLTYMAIG